jgi:hypothetical protein
LRRPVFKATIALAACSLALVFVGFSARVDDDAAAPRPQNLVPNGSFERSLSGWSGNNARLIRIRESAAGRAAARVVAMPGAADFSIYSPVLVRATPGRVYTASGWVRSPSPAPVCLRIREWSGDNPVDSAEQCVRPAAARWRKFPAIRLAVGARGRRVDVYAYRLSPSRGSHFDVDGISLVARRATPSLPMPSGPTIVAAGDVASCGRDEDEATARLLDRLPGTVVTLGDNAYEDGTREQLVRCYHPTWGRHKGRTRPSPGNHDYHSRGAAPYYDYFGAAAGERRTGSYSFSVGTWHLISLNSNCDAIGGCGAGSPQDRWLRAYLQANRAQCTLAYWHHPRFSSGSHGDQDEMHRVWQVLYDAGVDVILSGHDHNYERFAPQTPAGTLDRRRGIRQFVVGTGGARLRPMPARVPPTSEIRNSTTHGVLVMSLRQGGYSWRFVPVAGKSFTDTGSGSCH